MLLLLKMSYAARHWACTDEVAVDAAPQLQRDSREDATRDAVDVVDDSEARRVVAELNADVDDARSRQKLATRPPLHRRPRYTQTLTVEQEAQRK